MTTNGVYLNRHLDFLAVNDFLLLISLDGNKSNNQYRVSRDNSASYDTVTKNIHLLKKKYPE